MPLPLTPPPPSPPIKTAISSGGGLLPGAVLPGTIRGGVWRTADWKRIFYRTERTDAPPCCYALLLRCDGVPFDPPRVLKIENIPAPFTVYTYRFKTADGHCVHTVGGLVCNIPTGAVEETGSHTPISSICNPHAPVPCVEGTPPDDSGWCCEVRRCDTDALVGHIAYGKLGIGRVYKMDQTDPTSCVYLVVIESGCPDPSTYLDTRGWQAFEDCASCLPTPTCPTCAEITGTLVTPLSIGTPVVTCGAYSCPSNVITLNLTAGTCTYQSAPFNWSCDTSGSSPGGSAKLTYDEAAGVWRLEFTKPATSGFPGSTPLATAVYERDCLLGQFGEYTRVASTGCTWPPTYTLA